MPARQEHATEILLQPVLEKAAHRWGEDEDNRTTAGHWLLLDKSVVFMIAPRSAAILQRATVFHPNLGTVLPGARHHGGCSGVRARSARSTSAAPSRVVAAGASRMKGRRTFSGTGTQTMPVSGPLPGSMLPMLSVPSPMMLAIETSSFACFCPSKSKNRPPMTPRFFPPAITIGERSKR